MYNTYFGFSESPFSVTPDPRFFYSNPIYQEAYANLRYGIEAKKGFIVITGEVGTGKTTLLRKLMRNLGDTIQSVFIFNTDLTFAELLPFILHDLGLEPRQQSKVAMLQELNDYLIKQLERGHIVAVLIDEAQNLSDEALEGLRLLSNLETDQEKLVQIVLMGQPELERKLDRPTLRQFKQRVALQGRLAPLKDEEVGSYIAFRLRVAGHQGSGLFHPDAVREIALYSKGLPRLTNIICDNALLNAYGRSQATVSADIIGEVARDLRLESQARAVEAEIIPAPLLPETDSERVSIEASSRVPQRKLKRMGRVGFEAFLIIFILVTALSLTDPQKLSSIAERGLKVATQNLNQWAMFATHQEAVPKKVIAEVEFKMNDHWITIPQGSNIDKIASEAYGANTDLGMDLIKEFNPQIKNLNRVAAGQDLLLPSPTQETLLRKQVDGSYSLIMASFRSVAQANQYAQRLSSKGYEVTIEPRKVADDLLLYRVQIDGLKDLGEASHIWQSEFKNQRIALANNPATR